MKCETMYDNEKSIRAGSVELDDGADFTEEEIEQAARYERTVKAAAKSGAADQDEDHDMPTGHADRASEVYSSRTTFGENPLSQASSPTRDTRATTTAFSPFEAETFGITLAGPIVFKTENTKDYRAATDKECSAVVSNLHAADDNKERLAALCLALEDKFTFTCAQLGSFLAVTTSVKTKLAMVELVAPRLSDPKDIQSIAGEFKYATEKSQVENVIRQRIPQLDLYASPQKSAVEDIRRSFGASGGRGGDRGSRGGRGDRGSRGGRGGVGGRNGLSSPSSVSAGGAKLICSGSLFKKSKYWGEWRKRHITITNPGPGHIVISWFDPKNMKAELGSFNLPDATFKQMSDEVFIVVSSGIGGAKVKELQLKSLPGIIKKWCATIKLLYKDTSSNANWIMSDDPVPAGVGFRDS